MTRHVVIGTAGHVDHGKTALVRALTGVDTDRWEEEKRRGITIDLGFAPLELGNGMTASVVDVPGHEDFVRNMVAGATGIDVALLVVAADEGVMPQTSEHLAILEFLGLRTGVVAVTKLDLADADWLQLVHDDLEERLAGSSIQWFPVVRTSATTGEGVEALRSTLARAAGASGARDADDLFRMPVDRAFSIAGAGTVVTGTVWSGTLAVGDAVSVLPSGATGRVRGIEVHDVPHDRAVPGRRTALALAGVDRAQLARGECVVAADAPWRPTRTIDALVTQLPLVRPLRQRSRVRLHLGTAEVFARVTPMEEGVPAGGSAVVRLRLDEPIVARWGDRGVLRSYSPVTTIAGCRVLDPYPPSRPRRPVGALGLDAADPDQRLTLLVTREAERGVQVHDLPVRLGITRRNAERTAPVVAGRIVPADGRLFPAARLDAARRDMLDALTRYHAGAPLESGMSLEALRRVVRPPSLAAVAERSLVQGGDVTVDGAHARLATHEARLPAELETAAANVRARLAAARYEGATVEELAADAGGMEMEDVRRLAEFLVREGTALRIGATRYYDAAHAGRMVDAARDVLRSNGQIELAQLRDQLGLTRKYLIPFLEWMDQQGFTVRRGDVRMAGPRLDAPAGPP